MAFKFTPVVRKRMSEMNLRPSDLARKTGYSGQHIRDLLSGKRRWNETTINKLCEVLRIRVDFIFSKQSKANQENPNSRSKAG